MKAFVTSMAEALRLTRKGDPAAASRSLQRLLMNAVAGAVPPPADTPSATVSTKTIDPRPSNEGPASEATAHGRPAMGGTVQEKRHVGASGALGYRLYLPANPTPGMPVVIMLHGCTQSPEDFAIGTAMDQLADELGFIVAYPRQTASANAHKCWNWFKPDDQERDRGEPSLIAGIAREILVDHQGDPRRVYVAGLSAGGAAAAVLADQYGDLFAAVGVHSGLPCGAAHDMPSAMSAMKMGGRARSARPVAHFVPTITFHGDRDMTVNETNSRAIVAAASAAANTPLSTRTDAGQHSGGRRYTRLVSSDDMGKDMVEQWTIHGSGHAWSGGRASGSYTDPQGPDASREMLRFFLSHRLPPHV